MSAPAFGNERRMEWQANQNSESQATKSDDDFTLDSSSGLVQSHRRKIRILSISHFDAYSYVSVYTDIDP